MNFKKPSKIQERALPLLLSNPVQNMIGQSQSGTGKTAAFVLTMLSRLDHSKPKTPQALCLAPSRELARQIMGVVQTMGSFVESLTVEFAIPQMVARGQRIEAEVVVGTPGTTLDMIKRRQLDVSQIKVFVLDEADNMIDQQGLGEQCLRVRSYVHFFPLNYLFRRKGLKFVTVSCQGTLRSSSFRQHFRKTLSDTPRNLPQMPIQLLLNTRNLRLRESSNSTWTATPRITSTRCL
jgi:superfamily II DNA/RNA helicase